MKTVLVITSSQDSIMDYIVAIYSKKCFFFRLDLDRMCDYSFQLNGNGWSIDNYREFITDKTVNAIYYRKPSFPDFRKYDGFCQDLMKKDIEVLIRGITDAFDGNCLSKPYIIEKAENKIYQMYLAEKYEMAMPDCLIANNRRCIERFCINKKSAVKSLVVGRDSFSKYTKEQTSNFFNYNNCLDGLEVSPVYFQEYIEKDYMVTANFIGKKAYVARIDIEVGSNKKVNEQKWRYSNMYLPKKVGERCLNFMKELGIEFGAFDFIVKNGTYYFLEFKPDAQWLGFENELGWDLSAELVEYLCS
ncbi:MAG: hypothetical protein E7222_13495 [Clostridiales bacterium]|nr:hypothetical protein [Clostridiales bacterium]